MNFIGFLDLRVHDTSQPVDRPFDLSINMLDVESVRSVVTDDGTQLTTVTLRSGRVHNVTATRTEVTRWVVEGAGPHSPSNYLSNIAKYLVEDLNKLPTKIFNVWKGRT